MAEIKLVTPPNAGEEAEPLDPSYAAGGDVRGTAPLENSLTVSLKLNMPLPCDTEVALLDVYPREMKTSGHQQKDLHTNMFDERQAMLLWAESSNTSRQNCPQTLRIPAGITPTQPVSDDETLPTHAYSRTVSSVGQGKLHPSFQLLDQLFVHVVTEQGKAVAGKSQGFCQRGCGHLGSFPACSHRLQTTQVSFREAGTHLCRGTPVTSEEE